MFIATLQPRDADKKIIIKDGSLSFWFEKPSLFVAKKGPDCAAQLRQEVLFLLSFGYLPSILVGHFTA